MYEAGYDEPSLLEKQETGVEDTKDEGDVSSLYILLLFGLLSLALNISLWLASHMFIYCLRKYQI